MAEKYMKVEGIISPDMNKKVSAMEQKKSAGMEVTEEDCVRESEVLPPKEEKEKMSFKEKWRIRLKAMGAWCIKTAVLAGAVVGLVGLLMPSLVVGTVGATLATVGLVANVADTGAKTASVFETGKLILNPASGR